MAASSTMPGNGVVGQDYLSVLFDSLTLEQLRLVFANLWQGEEVLPSVKSRREAIQQIYASGGAPARIVGAALDVEASSAMKHCFLGKVTASEGVATLASASAWEDFSFGSLQARVARVRATSKRLQLTLEQFILSKEWKEIDERTKVIEEKLVRHPMLVSFNMASSTMTVEYPGYSSGSASKIKDRVSYEQIVTSLLSLLRERFAISVGSLAIGDAIHALQAAGSPRIRLVSADVEAAHGRVSLSTSSENESVSKLLADILGSSKGVAKADIEDIASTFIRRSSANALLVFWTDEKIFTRIRFWASGAELLFIWHGQDQSSRVVRDLVTLIADLSKGATSGAGRDAWTLIAETQYAGILTPRVLAERSGSSVEECGKILVEAERAALVEPVFRIKSAQMLDTAGERWTRDLSALLRKHSFEGAEIDGNDPSNIEVGFRRISKGRDE